MVKQGAISIMSQSVSSAGNFLAVIIPAKVLPVDEFGNYIVALTTILLLAGFSRALVGMPIRIQGIDVDVNNKEQYFASLTFVGLIIAILSGIISAPIMMLSASNNMSILLVTVLATAAFQIYDLSRAVRASQLQWTRILMGDVILHAVRIVVLGILAMLGNLDVTMALLVYAGASIASPIFTRFPLRVDFELEPLKETIINTWVFGRWLFMETIVSSLSTQFYVLFTSGFLGPAAAGVLGALQQIIKAINVIQIGIHDYLVPHVRSRLNQGDYYGWIKWNISGGVVMVVATILVVIPLVVYQEYIIGIIYTDAVSGHRYVLLILGISAVICAVNVAWTIAYRTSGMPEAGFMAKVISALVTVTLGVLLVKSYGLIGAATGVLLTQIIWLFIYIYLALIHHSLSQHKIKHLLNKAELLNQ